MRIYAEILRAGDVMMELERKEYLQKLIDNMEG